MICKGIALETVHHVRSTILHIAVIQTRITNEELVLHKDLPGEDKVNKNYSNDLQGSTI